MFRKKLQETNSNYTNLLSLNFAELSDFIEDYNPTTIVNANGYEMGAASTSERDSQFHGDVEFGSSLEASKRLLTIGYQPDAMKGAFAGFDTAFESSQEITKMSEEGYAFDVPSILSGEDEVWFQRKNVGSAPSIHIVFEGGANSNIPAMNFYIQSAVVTKLSEILSDEAHIRVSATYSAKKQGRDVREEKDVNNVTYISMKDYDEAVDTRRLGAISHPSFFRRVVFSILENGNTEFFGKDYRISSGYGRQSERKELGVTEELENELFESDIVVNIPSPSHSAFDNVDNAIEFCKARLNEINAMKVA